MARKNFWLALASLIHSLLVKCLKHLQSAGVIPFGTLRCNGSSKHETLQMLQVVEDFII